MKQTLKRILKEVTFPFKKKSNFFMLLVINALFVVSILFLSGATAPLFEKQTAATQMLANSIATGTQDPAEADQIYSDLITTIFRGVMYIIFYIVIFLFLLSLLDSLLFRMILGIKRMSNVLWRLFGLYLILFVVYIVVLFIPIYPMAEIIKAGGVPSGSFVVAFYVLLFLLVHLSIVSSIKLARSKGVFNPLKTGLQLMWKRLGHYVATYLIVYISILLVSVLAYLAGYVPPYLAKVLVAVLLLVYMVWLEVFVIRMTDYLISRIEGTKHK